MRMAKSSDNKNSGGKLYTIVREGDKMEEDTAWVFESLVGFLTGPVWNIPMMNFIENKSSVFDPSEDNHDEYRKIHEEYKNLVDLMLNSFTQDLGITAEQFENACHKANGDIVASQLQKTLFDQIWAAEDYSVFIRMMIQKNTELQLQALKILKERGISFDFGGGDSNIGKRNGEDAALQHALQRSIEEHDEVVSQSDKEKNDLERVLAATLDDERQRLELENKAERELLEKAVQLSLEQDKSPSSPSSDDVVTVPLDFEQNTQLSEPTKHEQMTKKQISDEEVAQRQSYLRQQRDKLLAVQQKKRMRQLDELDRNGGSQQRPRSAIVAKEMLQNNGSDTQIDPKMLAARHALAARLKAEVLGNK